MQPICTRFGPLCAKRGRVTSESTTAEGNSLKHHPSHSTQKSRRGTGKRTGDTSPDLLPPKKTRTVLIHVSSFSP